MARDAAASGTINVDEALGIWVRERTGGTPSLEAMQAVLAADGLCACAVCGARVLAWAADTWLGGAGASLVMATVLERARGTTAIAGHRTPSGGAADATPAGGRDDLAVQADHTRPSIVAVQVEHRLSLVDLAEVLCRWLSANHHGAEPPTSTDEALAIVRDTLAFDGEQWDRWRRDELCTCGREDPEAVVRTAYGWAARFFGPMFGDREREQLAHRLATEAPEQTP